MNGETIRISTTEMRELFTTILMRHTVPHDKASTCARIFTENSLDGVYTHGVNRFPKFVQFVDEGFVNVDVRAERISGNGAFEQWNGNSGIGIINALDCTERVTELAKENGLGCVALANTNHWMRGGTYGWHAARKGFAFIGWTNTLANMPAWGATDNRLGNNPLVIAVPYRNEAVVLDMAMSQYSYGALELYDLQNLPLPVPGGMDAEGNPTTDAGEIRRSRRALPIGYWKGAGLSLLLDILATILSGGNSTAAISKLPAESQVSQVFMAIDLSSASHANVGKMIKDIIEDYRGSVPAKEGKKITYPGERVVNTRMENLEKGIPVLRPVWEEIKLL